MGKQMRETYDVAVKGMQEAEVKAQQFRDVAQAEALSAQQVRREKEKIERDLAATRTDLDREWVELKRSSEQVASLKRKLNKRNMKRENGGGGKGHVDLDYKQMKEAYFMYKRGLTCPVCNDRPKNL